MRSTSISNNSMFICTKCDAQFLKWSGRCSECQGWGTLQEGTPDSSQGLRESKKTKPAAKAGVLLVNKTSTPHERITSGEAEVDRVLGDGIVPGSLILLSGEPGS